MLLGVGIAVRVGVRGRELFTAQRERVRDVLEEDQTEHECLYSADSTLPRSLFAASKRARRWGCPRCGCWSEVAIERTTAPASPAALAKPSVARLASWASPAGRRCATYRRYTRRRRGRSRRGRRSPN